MIRAGELHGRAVVDLDLAEKLGEIREVVLDPARAELAGLVVAQGHGLFASSADRRLVASSRIHAIGPDAVTVQSGPSEDASFDGLPMVSEVVGRKLVSHSGEFLGCIEDVLIQPETGRIVGYAFSKAAAGVLGQLFRKPGRQASNYVRGDANLRVGKDVIVVPDEAVVLNAEINGEPTTVRWSFRPQGGTA